ncbi:TonB family protein [Undibacterium sp. Ji49W]|uniref:TonB family protein n=1 Tax=Undibacterium sp. Ji49W TaxID=3413040 RepID=UPI003BF32989
MHHSKSIFCFAFLSFCFSIQAFAQVNQQINQNHNEPGSRIIKSGCKASVPTNTLQNLASAIVTLQYIVNEKSEITDIKILKTSGDNLLDDAARTAMSTCSLEAISENEKTKQAWYKTQWEFKSEEQNEVLTAIANNAQPISIRPGVIDMSIVGCTPDYPKEGLKTNVQGTVLFSALIDATGLVTKVTIIESSKSQLLDDAITNRLMEGRCRTKPGTFDGSPASTVTKIRYIFRLK